MTHLWQTTHCTDFVREENCENCDAKRTAAKSRGWLWNYEKGGETCFTEELSPAQERLKATGTE